MSRPSRALSIAITCALFGALAAAAGAAPKFRPRIGGAMGLVPPAGHQEIALGSNLPLLFHGGSVMRNPTVHTVFWAPSGFAFDGSPGGSSLGYEALIQQFITDVAHDSGAASNVFSVLSQYGDGSGPGSYQVHYNAAADSIDATDPYPPAGSQCASPNGLATCITDLQVQQEIEHLIRAHDPNGRGLGNVWMVFLPPNVDTCVSPGACGSNAFGGYHSLSNFGRGVTIYANIPDALIETTVGPGSDPQGNPDAETAIDTTGHELAEAITDPKGDGWMDPNGSEVGDKCETGPETGTPLGFAPDGSPYNQVIDSNHYLLQMMWANSSSGCVQRSSATSSPLPLAQVNLEQFSSTVSGAIGVAKPGIAVSVSLLHAGTYVAHGSTTTDAHGRWRVALRSRTPHGVGDDRDELDVDYGRGGPTDDVIATGDGGNPFTQAGWTGWYDLDNGFAIVSGFGSSAVAVSPCSQTGVLTLTIDRSAVQSPVDACETETDAAIIKTKALNDRSVLSLSSNDNRAIWAGNLNGALVDLTVPLGEPDAVSANTNPLVPIPTGGFPTCAGDLHDGVVRCSGLVPGASYAVTRLRGGSTRRAPADVNGSVRVGGFRLTGGDVLRLTNDAGRTLTTLHLAHLRVHINGQQTVIASGSCEPGEYYGRPLTAPPVALGIGRGIAGTGTICPLRGSAVGLSSTDIEQTDDRSGGQTITRVPQIEDTSPVQDAVVYGRFTALAGAGLPGPNGSVFPSGARVSLTIRRSLSRHVIFRATNVNTVRGVDVRGLPAGVYSATWVLTDANGDTRTVRTRFIEEPAHGVRRVSTPSVS